MSKVYTELKNPSKFKPTSQLWVTIDPKTTDQLPFPRDYKYFPCLLPKKYLQFSDRIDNFEVRPDDIWVIGYPKTGSTWTENIVNQLIVERMSFSGYQNDPAKHGFNMPYYYNFNDKEDNQDAEEIARFVAKKEKLYDELDALPSPRVIKTHLPPFLLPKQIWTVKPKLVFISRNAKDVAISYYHMSSNSILRSPLTMSEFFEDFRNDLIIYSPFHEYVHGYQQLRHIEHLHLMTYEELKTNPLKTIKKLSEFLECSYSDEQLNKLIEYTSFDKMKDVLHYANRGNDSTFKFCRKGKVGGYRDDMSEEEIVKFDKWIAKNKEELNLL